MSGTMVASRTLLVDDHALVRSGLRVLIEQMPEVEVIGEAGNGREALELVERERPAIVIMDIAMPEMNGLEALIRIKKLLPTVRVIILSMYASSEHVQRALDGGADGYIVKAAAQEELELALRAIREGNSYLSPAVTQGALDPATARRSSPNALTSRQREILQLVAEGNSTKAIARKLDVSVKTVEGHRSQLMTRLAIRNVPGLVRYAIRAGIIESEA
jgi:DNA-binding NarL/FixJ family response regulator